MKIPTMRILVAALALGSACRIGAADEKELAKALNTPLDVITEPNRGYRVVFDAILAMTPPPAPIGPAFNPTTIWPGMAGWSKVSEWAKANPGMGEALVKAQDLVALALPYGSAIDSKYTEAGFCVRLGDGQTMAAVEYPYLDKMTLMSSWAVAEMYRLGEEGKFEEAFRVAIANLRVLRQGCDQRTIREKSFFMELLLDCLSVNRDFMWTYLEKIPAAELQKASLKGYGALRQMDGERLRRLEMPEGDRIIQVAVLRESFGSNGQADPERFATIWGSLQSKSAPLTRFGAARFWRLVASVHGSIDASEMRLEHIYDDWWRRWRMGPFDPIQEIDTVLSKTNPTKYAAVMLTVTDMTATFELRRRLIAEVNGTAMAAGLSAFRRAEGSWPNLGAMVFPTYAMKRMSYDPFVKHLDGRNMPTQGVLSYRMLSSPTKVVTEWGDLQLSDFVLYALGFNLHDDDGFEHTRDGKGGDLVLYPALRAVARQQGKLK
ncbi:MAG: hypothetical protein FJ253_09035 [Phycisphaerae bacterium]|nr:hypothetical protein [Phycisphaerae bacterium]